MSRIVLLCVLVAPALFAADDDDAPLLIQKASPSIQKAWRQVDNAIKDNDRLKKPLPEPYLARAEIWAMVGNYDEALADQLRATELLYKGTPSLIEQKRYLERMQKTLDRLRKMPRPYFPVDADKLYYLGRSFYFQGDCERALKELNEAIRLRPDEPLYWYYRALTYRRLGKNDEATRDARVAASLRRAGKSRKDIARELERIQGAPRVWLNEQDRWRPDDTGR
jgi:tetratricopeptide (TPR) repeat protein